ncbi:MAG: DUF6034 family protein, partial [Clostridia bacterium]|nr:DUF6034 family protein [Clostridia bacterium]
MKRFGLIIIAFLLLAGCKPTPEDDVVVNRGDRLMEDKITSAALEPYAYEYADKWEQTIPLKNTTIVIDASVEVNEANMFPVQTVQKVTVCSEDVYELVTGLFPDAKEIRTNRFSAEELAFDMQMVLRGTFSGIDDETGEIIWAPSAEQDEQTAEIQALL